MGTTESVSQETQPLGIGSTGLRVQDTWRGVQKCFNFFEGQKKKKNEYSNNESSLNFICLSQSQNMTRNNFMEGGALEAKVPMSGPRRVVFGSVCREKAHASEFLRVQGRRVRIYNLQMSHSINTNDFPQ